MAHEDGSIKLSRFILTHMDEILGEWECFARSLSLLSSTMPDEDLQDHAREMLSAIAADMETSQSAQQKKEKSIGNELHVGDTDSAATIHGSLRQISGFTMPQLTAEFRAMRASVLRLWMDKTPRRRKRTCKKCCALTRQSTSRCRSQRCDFPTRAIARAIRSWLF